MAKQVDTPAKGDAKNTGSPGPTPAPVHQTFGGKGDQPIGNNRYGGPSSTDAPGQNIVSGFEAMKDPTGVLDTVQAKGLRPDDASPINGQIRKIAAGAASTHPGMSRRGVADGSPGGSVPAAVGLVEAQPVRQPGGKS